MASDETSSENENTLNRCLRFISYPLIEITSRIMNELYFFEQFYIKLYNIYAFVSQMLFFVLCSLVFHEYKGEDQRREEFVLIGLKTLLFYSVFTFFVTKTKDIVSSSQYRGITYNSNFVEAICKIILEWAKAVIVVICLREQGIYFKPSPQYAAITFTYYVCTEKVFSDMFQIIFTYIELETFESLEHLYVPMVINLYTIILGCSMVLMYFFFSVTSPTFLCLCLYFIIYIRVKDNYYNYWKVLKLEKQTFDNFRNANQKELDDYDDICAICLNKMSKAKITPCNHFFHPNCLKECLKNSFFCPICKVDF